MIEQFAALTIGLLPIVMALRAGVHAGKYVYSLLN